jgi:hypothetical protein
VHRNKKKPQEFECTFEGCTKTYKRIAYLRDHVRIKHDKSQKCVCKFCPTAFSSYASRRTHTKAQHLQPDLYACDACSYTSGYKKMIKKHLMKVHQEFVKEKISCSVCERQFSDLLTLRRHLMDNAGQVRSEEL